MAIWNTGLVIDGVEVMDIDMNSFEQHVEALYELAYKYDMIDLHKWNPPGEKTTVLAVCDAGLREAARVVADMLLQVFDHWLYYHALTDARTWAERRIETDDPEGFFAGSSKLIYLNENLLYDCAVSMYILEHPDKKSVPVMNAVKHYKPAFYEDIRKAAPKMKAAMRVAKELFKGLYDSQMEDYKAGHADKPVKIPPDELLDYYDVDDMIGMVDDYDAHAIMVDILEYVVFPVWYARFKEAGIVQTRKRIENARAQLADIKKYTANYEISDLITKLNLIIHTEHQSGEMIAYIDQMFDDINYTYGGSDNLFDWLSNMPAVRIAEFDRELKQLGMLPDMDTVAFGRRRARAMGREIVRAAWEELARKQRNPKGKRLPVQQLVIRMLRRRRA